MHYLILKHFSERTNKASTPNKPSRSQLLFVVQLDPSILLPLANPSESSGLLLMHFLKFQVSLQNAGLLLTIFFHESTITPPADSVPDTEALETGDNLFAQSFKPGDLSDEDDIPPMPNATCKMRAGCRVVATYKSKAGIACAEHAMEDMHPFTQGCN